MLGVWCCTVYYIILFKGYDKYCSFQKKQGIKVQYSY